MIVITHYQRLLDYIVPDYVHVLSAGRIVQLRRQGTGPRTRRSAATAGSSRRGAARPRTGAASGSRAMSDRRHRAGRGSARGRDPAGCRPAWLARLRQRAIGALCRRRLADPSPSTAWQAHLAGVPRAPVFATAAPRQRRTLAQAALGNCRRDGEAGHWLVFVDGVSRRPCPSSARCRPARRSARCPMRWRACPSASKRLSASAEAGASPAALNAALADRWRLRAPGAQASRSKRPSTWCSSRHRRPAPATAQPDRRRGRRRRPRWSSITWGVTGQATPMSLTTAVPASTPGRTPASRI